MLVKAHFYKCGMGDLCRQAASGLAPKVAHMEHDAGVGECGEAVPGRHELCEGGDRREAGIARTLSTARSASRVGRARF